MVNASILDYLGKVKLVRVGDGVYEVLFEGKRAVTVVEEPNGCRVVKRVELVEHGGAIGQYLVKHNMVAVAKPVAEKVEEAFKGKLAWFEARFTEKGRLKGVVRYTYGAFLKKRRLKRFQGYESQYMVPLPPTLQQLLNQATPDKKVFIYTVGLGREELKWINDR